MMREKEPLLPLLSLFATSLSALYATLDPTSVSQHFAFYELYPDTYEGKEALHHAWDLLSAANADLPSNYVLPSIDLKPLINFVNRVNNDPPPLLEEAQLALIEKLSSNLLNRRLKSFSCWNLDEFLKLPNEELDLARGLLLAEMGNDLQKIRSYEANLDLMALQILARLKPDATPLEKVRVMNDYIFSEMRFRFPPHSLHAKEIDVYTFLPSVLDSRRGVCLGVSILYLALGQRLGLHLEAITPPGHIYVRYKDQNGEITNIETTARGIDVPCERYLGLETKKLQMRTLKEVIGLAFMNQASVSWQKDDPNTAITLYEKAKLFLDENDYLLNMFLGFNYLFVHRDEEGKKLLEKIKGIVPEHAISPDSISEDFLAGHTDGEAIRAIYSEVNESRNSILEKQKKLEAIVKKFPRFRQALFHLSVTWLQLGREKEALPILEKYAQINPTDPTAHYYIASIQFQRHHFNQAWKHLRASEAIVSSKGHHPKALKELKQALLRACPEP
jgi:tetratricopeptide (TPR) repeat protein